VEKNLRRRVRRLRWANPGKRVEVWAEDEARLGLKPVTRRVWWLRGRRPQSGGQTRYEWLYVYGFARPATGETFTLILPRVKVERMADALAAFAAHADPGGTKVLVLVVDRAGWHTAKRLAAPANVRLHFLPPCTPELQPVEPFWALVREAVANETFGRLADLRRVVRRRCRWLAADRTIVKGAIGFHWAVNLES
jgi:transposase